MEKYYKLKEYFKNSKEEKITMSLKEIEGIVDDKLPKSAYKYPCFYGNDPTHPIANSWMSAGYMSRDIDLEKEEISFIKKDKKEDAYITYDGFKELFENFKVYKLKDIKYHIILTPFELYEYINRLINEEDIDFDYFDIQDMIKELDISIMNLKSLKYYRTIDFGTYLEKIQYEANLLYNNEIMFFIAFLIYIHTNRNINETYNAMRSFTDDKITGISLSLNYLNDRLASQLVNDSMLHCLKLYFKDINIDDIMAKITYKDIQDFFSILSPLLMRQYKDDFKLLKDVYKSKKTLYININEIIEFANERLKNNFINLKAIKHYDD